MRNAFTYAAAAALAFAAPTVAGAQSAPTQIVSLYRAAPGQQVALLKWLEQQERVAAAAGVPASQLYVHADGDSWDYMLVSPATTPAQDAATEAAARKMGVANGPRAGIELRKYIAIHTDTFVRGPSSVSDYLAAIGER